MTKNKEIKTERFKKIYSQGKLDIMEIWEDQETGIQYLYHQVAYAGGLTPLLDQEGYPLKREF
ncbi:DUF6440 family protein [Listeria fleischmannii]|uniref:DUF6440 domain-containing protein n=1 Tax=Listeria fleischmannii FSL S10-1203 TaxID=1265822 RepID=W7D5F9_9LIST|nr:DUF6440 family protein [Listeria fleischmannii]EUJ44442.1 hypothetical protein MCOL2_19926 [Listeria fleischmannii FSL S10-1203]